MNSWLCTIWQRFIIPLCVEGLFPVTQQDELLMVLIYPKLSNSKVLTTDTIVSAYFGSHNNVAI